MPRVRSRLIFGLLLGAWVLALTPSLFSQQQQQAPPPPPPPAVPPRVPEPVESRIQTLIDNRLVVGAPFRAPRRIADVRIDAPLDNPITGAKAALGKRLFSDPILSSDRTVSCATCHIESHGFADEKTLAVGIFGRVGKRHSPSLFNRAFGRAHFWDGRAATLEQQVLMPIADPNEMDLKVDDAVTRLAASDPYRVEFLTVFGRPVSSEDLGRALATFLRTLKSTDTPYDRFIDGDQTALSAQQQQGLQMFRVKGRCIFCHVEPLFTDEQFQNTGIAWQPNPATGTGTFTDDGRYGVTKLERDRGKFKTPTLREVARTAPYMHDGSLATLADVVDFYDKGGRPNPNLFPVLRPIGFTADEKQALVAFLQALSSK